MKLSTPRTVSPRSSNAAAMDRPINPATPVTRYFGKLFLQIALICRPQMRTCPRPEYYCDTHHAAGRQGGFYNQDMATVVSSSLAELKQRIESRQARVGIVGMGYVGLPLALLFSGER